MTDRPSPTQTRSFPEVAQLVANHARECVLAVTRDRHGNPLETPYCVLMGDARDEDIEAADLIVYPQILEPKQ